LSLGLTAGQDNLPDPRHDLVRPYCITFKIINPQADILDAEKQLREYGEFALVERRENELWVHLHTDEVGKVVENAVGWGPVKELRLINMSEPHVLISDEALLKVAVLVVADSESEAEKWRRAGAKIIVRGNEYNSPSLAELIGAAHSDLASTYVMIAAYPDHFLVFQQAKRILGSRVELVLCHGEAEAANALNAFDDKKSAAQNAVIMAGAARL